MKVDTRCVQAWQHMQMLNSPEVKNKKTFIEGPLSILHEEETSRAVRKYLFRQIQNNQDLGSHNHEQNSS